MADKDVTVPMEVESRKQVDYLLSYGDSRSEWIRDAISEQLNSSKPIDASRGNGPDNRKDVTVPMDQELHDQIVNELSFGDSKAEWIREAVRRKLKDQGIVEIPVDSTLVIRVDDDLSSDESLQEWVETAIREKLDSS